MLQELLRGYNPRQVFLNEKVVEFQIVENPQLSILVDMVSSSMYEEVGFLVNMDTETLYAWPAMSSHLSEAIVALFEKGMIETRDVTNGTRPEYFSGLATLSEDHIKVVSLYGLKELKESGYLDQFLIYDRTWLTEYFSNIESAIKLSLGK
jgi:DNA-binding transcriptional ArsR family regulator